MSNKERKRGKEEKEEKEGKRKGTKKKEKKERNERMKENQKEKLIYLFVFAGIREIHHKHIRLHLPFNWCVLFPFFIALYLFFLFLHFDIRHLAF